MTNVVLLVSDEHNPYYSATYGHGFIQTPNMDRLAERGTVFENAYCPSPLCVPSRSAFMAGRWTHEVQCYNNSKVIERRHPSYGSVLAAEGVHSLYVGGGSNLYRDPFALGFSEMLGVRRAERPVRGNAIRAPRASSAEPVRTAASGPVEGQYAIDDERIDTAVRWFHETAPTLDGPWTMTVDVHPPHPPYTTEPRYWEMYGGLGDLPRYGTEQPSAQHPYAQDIRDNGRWDYPEELVRELRQGYFGAVTYVDSLLGRLLDGVDAAGLADDTVVCYTTDHGEMLGMFGLWGKTSLYEHSVRVPILAAGPGFTPGRRVRTPVSTLDLQAAIFHAVGAHRPDEWRGEPLQGLPEDDARRTVLSTYHGHNVRGGGCMVRQGDWKLIYNDAAPHQLFDLSHDPDELVNLWEERPDMAAALEAELRSICDPEAVARDAAAVQEQQLAIVAEVEDRLGEGVSIPWEEAS